MKLSDIEQLEMIDRYLQGNLVGQELIEFKSKLVLDSELSKLVDIQHIANQLIIDAGLIETKDKIRQARQRYEAKNPKPSNISKWATLSSIVAFSFLFSTEPTGKSVLKLKTLPIEQDTIIEKLETYNLPSRSQAQTAEPIQQPTENTRNPYYASVPQAEVDVLVTEPEIQKVEPTDNKTSALTNNEVDPLPQSLMLREKPAENEAKVAVEVQKKDDKTTQKVDQVLKVENASKPVAPCNFDKSALAYTTSSSCEGRYDGAIVVVAKGLRNALYSIDGGSNYSRSSSFTKLSPGKYPVVVKAENDCIIQGDVVEVVVSNSGDCLPTAYHFNPDLGEYWNIPLPAPALLVIYDGTGAMVFRMELNGFNYEWRGVDNYNKTLPTGAYLYQIKYSDGKEFRGEISISR